MNASPLIKGKSLPLLINQPSGLNLEGTIEWLENHRPLLDDLTHTAGVVLLRKLPIKTPGDFEVICKAIRPQLRKYTGGDSPRNSLTEFVYTSTEYASGLEVPLHNELSYAGWSPDRVFFGCLRPAAMGGETQVADGRAIYRRLDPTIRKNFEDKGITYLQYLRDQSVSGTGKSWQETFETNSRKEVESYLETSKMDFEWTALGLKTRAFHQAILKHSVTGERCWHNQADQWHRLIPSVKDSVGEEITKSQSTPHVVTFGNHVVFGDESEINPNDLLKICAVSRSCEVLFPWQKGDVMIIDNVLAMHGRKPFTGLRQNVVAMA